MVIVICFMAVTSSGASEMLAVSSLFTFDVYRRYINPKVLCRVSVLAAGSFVAKLHASHSFFPECCHRLTAKRLVMVSRVGVCAWAGLHGLHHVHCSSGQRQRQLAHRHHW